MSDAIGEYARKPAGTRQPVSTGDGDRLTGRWSVSGAPPSKMYSAAIGDRERGMGAIRGMTRGGPINDFSWSYVLGDSARPGDSSNDDLGDWRGEP